jgi:hypothetical protein
MNYMGYNNIVKANILSIIIKGNRGGNGWIHTLNLVVIISTKKY